jgi:KaiC/GvpD/RAD55 family RecA-like ATPase
MSDLQMPSLDAREGVTPRGHAVQFYENDSSLIQSLVRHVAPALVAGDTVIIIATGEHRQALDGELESRGIVLAAALTSQRYVVLDSAETLQKFLVEDWPDPAKFERVIGRLVEQAEASSRGHRLFLFGEMVARLWAEGKHEATLRLEELWNQLAARFSFYLLRWRISTALNIPRTFSASAASTLTLIPATTITAMAMGTRRVTWCRQCR